MVLNYNNKKVLVRVDFNVPLNDNHEVTDNTRIKRALPTLQHILEAGGSLILISHLGRPQKKLLADGNIDTEKFSLKHLVPEIEKILGVQVHFCPQTKGTTARELAASLEEGQAILLENTRFEKGEATGDKELAKSWADLADMYVNDAFGSAHRAHASTTTVADFFDKDNKEFGLLMQSELNNANKVLNSAKKPLTAIVGGAKVSDKINILKRLLDVVDNLIIGGGMAYTFVKSQGGKIGRSLVENDKLELASQLIRLSKEKGVNLYLPPDSVIADNFSADANVQITSTQDIHQEWMGLDIGPLAQQLFTEIILESKTILWNGPMGVFEFDAFAKGTQQIAAAVAQATQSGAYSLIGGGDSVAAVNQMKLASEVSYVSTGGGAMLELLEGKELPGVTAMSR